jgi:hypothetical protein
MFNAHFGEIFCVDSTSCINIPSRFSFQFSFLGGAETIFPRGTVFDLLRTQERKPDQIVFLHSFPQLFQGFFIKTVSAS